MKISTMPTFPQNLEAAIAIQQELCGKVIVEDRLEAVRYVAGVDVGFENNYSITRAAVAVFSFPELILVETAIASLPTTFPYKIGRAHV